MRKVWMLVTVSCLLWGRAAADDVYVDLSVLDGLDNAGSEEIAPLFPVFDDSSLRPLPKPVIGNKPRAAKPGPAKTEGKPEKTPAAVKAKAEPAVKAIPVPERKPNIRPLPVKSEPATEPVAAQKKRPAEDKAVNVKKAALPAKSAVAETKPAAVKENVSGNTAVSAKEKPTAERKKPAAKPAVKEKPAIKADIEKKSMPAVSRQPVLSAVAEPAVDKAVKAAAAKNVKAEKAVGAKDTERLMKAEAPREIPAAKAQISAAESRKEGEKHFAAEDKPAEKIPVKIEKTSSAPVVAKEKEPALQPLIPVAEEEPAADVIAFAGGVFELSAENTARLAAIADGFKRPGESKILIYAYNFNDGGNDFKNKRLSLNRAVEIRSYLMTRGYKNFGIKIVNTDNRGKQNTVEVFEQAD